MKNIFTKLISICTFLLCVDSGSYAQVDTSRPLFFQCGLNETVVSHYSLGSTGYPTYPAGAIISCGSRFKVYFDDLAEGILYNRYAGFDDTTQIWSPEIGAMITKGQIRRNTFCMALDYIEKTFDFSLVDTANPIRIKVQKSLSPLYNPAEVPTLWNARSFPSYDTTADGVTDGYFGHYVKTGVDIDTASFHADLQFNFDVTHTLHGITWYPYGTMWHDDGSKPLGCQLMDLQYVVLHELGHCMGWFSLVDHTGSTSLGWTPQPRVITHHVFSRLDSGIFVGGNIYPLTGGAGMIRLVNVSAGIPALNPAAISAHNNNYWLNPTEAPGNYPVYSGSTRPWSGMSGQFIAHLDDQQYSYTLRDRVSPGDRTNLIMGPFTPVAVAARTYSRADLYGFHNIMGYNYASTFNTVNPFMNLSNKPPYSRKMGSYNITRDNYGYATELVEPDDTLVNDIGSYIDIFVDSMTDIVDANGDPISIDTQTLVNFRGCGDGGNNHNSLAWLVPGKTLRYTPRPNFYGRAQFGFNVTDGIDSGSFVVYTIDVRAGTNVNAVAGENLVCNPGFEEGSEIITWTSQFVPNSYVLNGYKEGK